MSIGFRWPRSPAGRHGPILARRPASADDLLAGPIRDAVRERLPRSYYGPTAVTRLVDDLRGMLLEEPRPAFERPAASLDGTSLDRRRRNA